MEHFAITINRQFGSLGRPISMKTAELLGIEFYDRDIVEEVAKKMNLPVSIISDEEESTRGAFYAMKFPLGTGTSTRQDDIYFEQRKIITSIADRENCIIVGRCADYILQDHKKILKIYIYAPYEQRLKNCVETLGMKPEAAKKMISDVDKARIAYHRHYAGYLPGDYEHMDFMINSATLGVEGSAELIKNIVMEKFGNLLQK